MWWLFGDVDVRIDRYICSGHTVRVRFLVCTDQLVALIFSWLGGRRACVSNLIYPHSFVSRPNGSNDQAKGQLPNISWFSYKNKGEVKRKREKRNALVTIPVAIHDWRLDFEGLIPASASPGTSERDFRLLQRRWLRQMNQMNSLLFDPCIRCS